MFLNALMWGNLIWTSEGINSLFKAALKWRKQRKCSLWHFNASVLFFFFFPAPEVVTCLDLMKKNIKCHIRVIFFFFTSILGANRFHKQSRPLIWVMLVVASDSCKYVTEQKTRRGKKNAPCSKHRSPDEHVRTQLGFNPRLLTSSSDPFSTYTTFYS